MIFHLVIISLDTSGLDSSNLNQLINICVESVQKCKF